MLVEKLDECGDILALAYPGLGEPPRSHILMVADGNPKIPAPMMALIESPTRCQRVIPRTSPGGLRAPEPAVVFENSVRPIVIMRAIITEARSRP